ncbi:MAG: tetratricopeptide repeat protein, partial [Acidobacteriaceae bacterium]
MTDAFDRAAETFAPLGEAVMADPGVGYPWAESLAKTGDFTQAAVVLDYLQQQQLSADTLMLVGQTWSEMGNYQRAVAAFHQALEANPSLPRAHYLSGLAEIRAERPAEAAVEFQEELKIDPQNADAEYNLGYAYLQQSQRDRAEALFAKVVAQHPEHADAQYQLGKAKLEAGDTKQAIAHLQAAAKFAPEKDYIHYQLQAAYRKDDRLQDADRELALYKEAKARNRAASAPQNQEPEKAKQDP